MSETEEGAKSACGHCARPLAEADANAGVCMHIKCMIAACRDGAWRATQGLIVEEIAGRCAAALGEARAREVIDPLFSQKTISEVARALWTLESLVRALDEGVPARARTLDGLRAARAELDGFVRWAVKRGR